MGGVWAYVRSNFIPDYTYSKHSLPSCVYSNVKIMIGEMTDRYEYLSCPAMSSVC